jgi:hypothetical protein
MIEIIRDVLIYVAGTIAIAILAREAHVLWLGRQERKAIERMEERYWQEMKDSALDEAEAILKESGKR